MAAVTSVALKLLVLKTLNLERLLAFYGAIGIEFREEQHGKGPLHYAGTIGDLVLELYPAAVDSSIDSATRLGFGIANLDEFLAALRLLETPIINPPQPTEWGYRAVVRDPDGRAVELYQQ